MIVVKIYGGLAGQMLQYSLGRHLSIKYKTDLYLDTSWYKENINLNFPREFTLNKLKTNYKLLNRSNLFWRVKLTKRYYNLNVFAYKEITENDFSKFDTSILEAGNNIVLDGYWNSYKYFESIRSILLDELRPREIPDEQNERCLDKIKNVNSVSIHFRRGDYALTSFHGILSKEYYTKAIDTIAKSIANPYLFIFSDEPEWVLSNMNFQLPYEIVDFNKDKRNLWDIELMKNCKHNIIANSGFSWWAAWLNDNPAKMVIGPEKWINSEKSKIDNIPEGWILY